ncbi:isoprenylcysteine carboxylmethyltransferase family protein [Candidatus Pacearchaeota archaeon]|nr:isoprenylcysteine carboxylmethyltransferase family protein [Candidatus Pacearchaeota archaeon]
MKIKLMPPMIFYGFILLSIILNLFLPIKKLIVQPYNYLGIVLVLFGLLIDVWAWMLFRRRKTTLNPYKIPSKLETSNLFKISRNPMYLGMNLILWGISILLGSLITFIFPIVFIILIKRLFIEFEENNLEKRFGKRYIDYKKKVRRWI